MIHHHLVIIFQMIKNGIHMTQLKARIQPYPLRMPPEVRSWYEMEAESNSRSLNGEILKLLMDRMNRVKGQRIGAGQK